MRPVRGGSGEIYCIIEQGRKGKKAFINVSLLFCMKCILGPYTMEEGDNVRFLACHFYTCVEKCVWRFERLVL